MRMLAGLLDALACQCGIHLRHRAMPLVNCARTLLHLLASATPRLGPTACTCREKRPVTLPLKRPDLAAGSTMFNRFLRRHMNHG